VQMDERNVMTGAAQRNTDHADEWGLPVEETISWPGANRPAATATVRVTVASGQGGAE
jgi:hypothetical protein